MRTYIILDDDNKFIIETKILKLEQDENEIGYDDYDLEKIEKFNNNNWRDKLSKEIGNVFIKSFLEVNTNLKMSEDLFILRLGGEW